MLQRILCVCVTIVCVTAEAQIPAWNVAFNIRGVSLAPGQCRSVYGGRDRREWSAGAQLP